MKLDKMPNAPLTETQVKKVNEASRFTLKPSAITDSGHVVTAVVIADDWFAGIDYQNGQWKLVFKEDKEKGEDELTLFMVAMERMGLA